VHDLMTVPPPDASFTVEQLAFKGPIMRGG
jgi:hypothetical protein